MEKIFTVTHNNKPLQCKINVFNREEDLPKSQQIKGIKTKRKIDIWVVTCFVELEEVAHLERKFYTEESLLSNLKEIEEALTEYAEDKIVAMQKRTVSDKLTELGFK